MKILSRVPRLGRRDTRGRMLPSRPAPSFRPRLEWLEERTLLNASPITTALQAGYGQLPLAFTVNEGQAAAPINYLAQGSGYSIALTARQAQVSLGQGDNGTTLDLQLAGANASAQAIGQDELITKSNYLIGSDPSKWHTNIANYGQVEYQNVYQGVDALYSGNQGQLETTFVVHPGASAGVIQMQVQGAQSLSLDAQGDLVLHTSAGDVIEQVPVAYQDIDGVRQSVSSRYVLEGDNTVGFQVGAFDPRQTLVIDPTLSYSSYLPNVGFAVAADGGGNVYLTGHGWNGPGVYVAKLNATGTALDWITNLGSGGVGTSIALDAAGDVYVAGNATGLPTTPNALAPTITSSSSTGFLSVLNPPGSGLLYSTWLPGTTQGGLGAGQVVLALDHSGDGTGSPDHVYLTGMAGAGFLTTASAYQPNYPSANAQGRSAFFAEIDPNLSGTASLLYGSYLGGTLNATGANSGNDGYDAGTGIVVDASGNAYLTGRTASTNFPTTPGAFQTTSGGGEDVFISKFNPSLSGASSLVYSTYLGGNGYDGSYTEYPHVIPYIGSTPGPGIAVDSAGDAYVTGTTTSANFRTTSGAFQTTYHNASNFWQPGDAFVTKLNPTGTGLVYSTLLGGSDNDGGTAVAVDASGIAYVTGWTRSTNFPTQNPIQAQKSSRGSPPAACS